MKLELGITDADRDALARLARYCAERDTGGAVEYEIVAALVGDRRRLARLVRAGMVVAHPHRAGAILVRDWRTHAEAWRPGA